MNKRIQALVEQAKQHALTTAPDCTRHPIDAYMEKFAELLVQECVTVAMRAVSDDEPKEAWYLIKEHFGVKR